MLGKRFDRNQSPIDEFTYFKRPNKNFTPGGQFDQYETPMGYSMNTQKSR